MQTHMGLNRIITESYTSPVRMDCPRFFAGFIKEWCQDQSKYMYLFQMASRRLKWLYINCVLRWVRIYHRFNVKMIMINEWGISKAINLTISRTYWTLLSGYRDIAGRYREFAVDTAVLLDSLLHSWPLCLYLGVGCSGLKIFHTLFLWSWLEARSALGSVAARRSEAYGGPKLQSACNNNFFDYNNIFSARTNIF